MAAKAQKKTPAKGDKSKKPNRRGIASRGKLDQANRRWWTDDERRNILNALDANGGSVEKTARETGVPRATLFAWKSGARCPEALQLRHEKKGDLAVALEELAWAMAAELPRKLEGATLRELASGIGVMVEKMKLLRGEHTSYGRTDNTNANLTLDLSKLTEHERSVYLALSARLLRPAGDAPPVGDPGTDGGDARGGTSRPVPRQLPGVLG